MKNNFGVSLRREGLAAQAEFAVRPLKRQLEVAGAQGARFAAILAPREYAARQAVVRDRRQPDSTRSLR